MKIIDIGICVDNNDPKGMGRIRCIRYSEYVAEKEKALGNVEPWSGKDLFLTNPFLPTNINFIPEIGQAVKIINYNTDNLNVNQEYIAGPFTTMFDFNSQTFSQQVDNTTYGNANKKRDDIVDSKGNYIDKRTEGSFATKTDYGIYGKYGSDIIFSENGLQLRGGKLLSKGASSPTNRRKLLTYPVMGKRPSASLSLKKFPKKMELVEKVKNKVETEVKDIKYIIEYQIDKLTDTTKIEFFLYKILKTQGQVTKTSFFNENTPLPLSVLKLINTDNSQITPTFTIDVNEDNIDFIHSEITNIFYSIIDEGLKGLLRTFGELFSQLSNSDLPNEGEDFPLFFRPSVKFLEMTPLTPTEKINKENILSKVRVFTLGPKSGLIWSQTQLSAPTKRQKIKNLVLKTIESSPEQTFASLRSDKLFLLSTDTNEAGKSINFNNLNKYEYTQEDYIRNIEPNTFSTVRGENLIKILQSIILVLVNHEHNVTGPFVDNSEFEEFVQLKELLKTLENDILNKSIRIN
jgi:hypothetical protein